MGRIARIGRSSASRRIVMVAIGTGDSASRERIRARAPMSWVSGDRCVRPVRKERRDDALTRRRRRDRSRIPASDTLARGECAQRSWTNPPKGNAGAGPARTPAIRAWSCSTARILQPGRPRRGEGRRPGLTDQLSAPASDPTGARLGARTAITSRRRVNTRPGAMGPDQDDTVIVPYTTSEEDARHHAQCEHHALDSGWGALRSRLDS